MATYEITLIATGEIQATDWVAAKAVAEEQAKLLAIAAADHILLVTETKTHCVIRAGEGAAPPFLDI